MTRSAKFVVCGFWLAHNTPPRKIVQTVRSENRTVPRGATISITTTWNYHRVTAQTVLAIAAIAHVTMPTCKWLYYAGSSQFLRTARSEYVWIDVNLHREKFSISLGTRDTRVMDSLSRTNIFFLSAMLLISLKRTPSRYKTWIIKRRIYLFVINLKGTFEKYLSSFWIINLIQFSNYAVISHRIVTSEYFYFAEYYVKYRYVYIWTSMRHEIRELAH